MRPTARRSNAENIPRPFWLGAAPCPCLSFVSLLPPLMAGGSSPYLPFRLSQASPYGKGRWCAASTHMPPLLERGGVERSETEGIRKLDFNKTNRNAGINPQKGRHLLCTFCPYEMRSMSRKGRELCPMGAKREGKPRFSGIAARTRLSLRYNLSAEFSLLLFCPAKEKQRNPVLSAKRASLVMLFLPL